MQEPYNLLERRVEETTLPVAKKYGMAVMAYVPLAQGVLSGKYLSGVEKGSRASYVEQVAGQYLNTDTGTAVGGAPRACQGEGRHASHSSRSPGCSKSRPSSG